MNQVGADDKAGAAANSKEGNKATNKQKKSDPTEDDLTEVLQDKEGDLDSEKAKDDKQDTLDKEESKLLEADRKKK